jgi:hypothetical protein
MRKASNFVSTSKVPRAYSAFNSRSCSTPQGSADRCKPLSIGAYASAAVRYRPGKVVIFASQCSVDANDAKEQC